MLSGSLVFFWGWTNTCPWVNIRTNFLFLNQKLKRDPSPVCTFFQHKTTNADFQEYLKWQDKAVNWRNYNLKLYTKMQKKESQKTWCCGLDDRWVGSERHWILLILWSFDQQSLTWVVNGSTLLLWWWATKAFISWNPSPPAIEKPNNLKMLSIKR